MFPWHPTEYNDEQRTGGMTFESVSLIVPDVDTLLSRVFPRPAFAPTEPLFAPSGLSDTTSMIRGISLLGACAMLENISRAHRVELSSSTLLSHIS